MPEFLKLENFLLTQKTEDRIILDYLTHVELKRGSLTPELEYFFGPLHNKLELISHISSILNSQYFGSLSTKPTPNTESATVVGLLGALKQLSFIHKPTQCISELFACWFIVALSMHIDAVASVDATKI
jgi:hypothetical protein